MQVSLCNEVLGNLDFPSQCRFAAEVGYDGLEVAPYTLAEDPLSITDSELLGYKAVANEAGLSISGLHWLLLAPQGMSIVDPDPGVRMRTLEGMQRLVEMCALLGGSVLVHGSPRQRNLDSDRPGDRDRAMEYLARAGEAASKAGVTYCIEPLSRHETNFVNTLAEGVELVRAVNSTGLKTMLDTSAAANTEQQSIEALLDQWLPTGLLAHVQLNDRNRRGPGQGEDRFAPVLSTLQRHGWDRTVAVEPFVYTPDGPTTAARAIGYLRGILETLS